jgi:hypothetical protein
MGKPLSDEIKALVRGANFAHLATLMADGFPQVAPVWVDLEGDGIPPFPFRDNPDRRVVLGIEVDRARSTALPFKHTPA